MTSDNLISDHLVIEPRGILDKLNSYFSRDEPKIGYGKNIDPIVQKQPPLISTLDDNINEANTIYDDYYDFSPSSNKMDDLKDRVFQNYINNLGNYAFNQIGQGINQVGNKLNHGLDVGINFGGGHSFRPHRPVHHSSTPIKGGYGNGHIPEYSGFGYCKEDEISLPVLVTGLAGLALMWWVLREKIWQNGGRRKKRNVWQRIQNTVLNANSVLSGN